MKKSLLILTAILLLPPLYAQNPEISYIIPDIGAPGMNTYVEIIGPYDKYDNFGNDTLHFNNENSEVRIDFVNPGDSNKVTFSPLAVSWGGRMISVQAFVHTDLEPNSDRWDQLYPEFKIPVRVQKGSNYSNVDTFYIVKPFKLGDVTSVTNRVLGEGLLWESLGRRSRRGAMIVDSLIFPNDNFTVSIEDTDEETPGNQAYLPFILLSKGPVRGKGMTPGPNGTWIMVDGQERHGGPGGGGGGGRFFDASSLNPGLIGDDGGDGFTGGGPGGRNYTVILPFDSDKDKFKEGGTGTGPDGESLNGLRRGISEHYESAGGGTGHPFGRSGYGCNDGYSCDPDGGYGGASGGKQDSRGAGGGNASDGRFSTINGSQSGSNNGGKKHGNTYIVPFHGGSGGASGNPNSSHEGGGNAGGGGGAIKIFAPVIENIGIVASGHAGMPSTYAGDSKAGGGSSSGGCVTIQSKTDLQNILISIEGGSGGGGAGRTRYDLPYAELKDELNIENTPNTQIDPYYQGMRTDTNYFVRRNFQLNMSARPGFHKIRTFYKPLGGVWQEGAEAVDSDGDGNFTVDVNLPAPEEIFFFTTVEVIENPSDEEYLMDPHFVMSQAAANIFKIDIRPIICGDTVLTDTMTSCEGDYIVDSLRICNKGSDILSLELSKAAFQDGLPGFSYIGLNNDINLGEGDTIWVKVRYENQPGVLGLQTDTLVVPHNDTLSGHNPWKAAFSVYIQKIDMQYLDVNLKEIDTLDLGTHCLGTKLESAFIIQNLSEIELEAVNAMTGRAMFDVSPLFPPLGISPGDDTAKVNVSFEASAIGEYFAKLLLSADICPDVQDTLVLRAELVETDLKFKGNGDFGTLMLGEESQITVRLENTGNHPAYIKTIPPLSVPFEIIDISPPLPVLLLPDEGIDITVSFKPLENGTFTDTLRGESLEMNGACYTYEEMEIKGNAGGDKLSISKDTIRFGQIPFCQNRTDSVIIYNHSFSDVDIIDAGIIDSNPGAFFIVSPQPPAPQVLKAKDSITYVIRFDPPDNSDGFDMGDFLVKTGEPGNDSLLTVFLIGEAEQPNLEISPNPVNIGSYPIGNTVNTQFEIINRGEFDYTLNSITLSSADASVNPSSNVTILKNGGSEMFDLSVDITGEGAFEIFAYIEFNDPCLHRDTLLIQGSGLSGEIAYTDKINYGVLPWCKDSIMTIFFINTGDAPVTFLEMQPIAGQDNALFDFYDAVIPAPPPNSELAGGDTLFRQIRFDPSTAPDDGVKDAYVITKFIVNAEEQEFRTDLTGERRSGIVVVPKSIWFGNIVQGTTKDEYVTVKNDGKTTITLYEILPFANPDIFFAEPSVIDTTLAPGDSIIFKITFFAKEDIDYSDELKINILVDGVDCGGQIIVQLSAGGTPPKAVNVWMPDTTVTPDLDKFILPLYAGLENEDEFLENLSFKAVIRFNSSLFYPLSSSNGTVTRDFENNQTIVTIEVDSVDIRGRKSVLTELIGPTALGDRDTMNLIWDEIIWITPGLVDTTFYSNGSLAIEICRAGGDRLLDFSYPAFLKISPNPAAGSMEVDLRLLESGIHRLEILSLEGKSVSMKKWAVPAEGEKKYNFNFDLSSFSSGMYYLILRSPAKIRAYPLMIVR